ncbi:MAG: sigma-70 family RNA polymerase sigma factor [Acidobacteriota bacterium]
MADTTLQFQSEFALAAPRIHDGTEEDACNWAEDRTLAAGLKAGEETAYEALILRFEQPVFGVVSRLVDDPGDAADAVQEVFLKVFRNIGRFRGDSSLKTWIYRIAVNEARNQCRWFNRHRSREVTIEPATDDAYGLGDWVPDPSPGPFEEALNHEVHALVEEALTRISGTYRTALVLREVEELSYEEIAEILEISLGTVKSRIMRGREALRKELTTLARHSHVGMAPLAHLSPSKEDAL